MSNIWIRLPLATTQLYALCPVYICVWQNAVELVTLQDQAAVVQDFRSRTQKLTSDFHTVQMQLRFLQETCVPKERAAQLEAKIRELEGRVSFEVATRTRAEVCISTANSVKRNDCSALEIKDFSLETACRFAAQRQLKLASQSHSS